VNTTRIIWSATPAFGRSSPPTVRSRRNSLPPSSPIQKPTYGPQAALTDPMTPIASQPETVTAGKKPFGGSFLPPIPSVTFLGRLTISSSRPPIPSSPPSLHGPLPRLVRRKIKVLASCRAKGDFQRMSTAAPARPRQIETRFFRSSKRPLTAEEQKKRDELRRAKTKVRTGCTTVESRNYAT
jgi:hypothetical protein